MFTRLPLYRIFYVYLNQENKSIYWNLLFRDIFYILIIIFEFFWNDKCKRILSQDIYLCFRKFFIRIIQIHFRFSRENIFYQAHIFILFHMILLFSRWLHIYLNFILFSDSKVINFTIIRFHFELGCLKIRGNTCWNPKCRF